MSSVVSTRVGYTGGQKKDPTYEEVSAGGTGHPESIEVTYDPDKISYRDLLKVFWHNVDPTTKDREFCDVGRQYRTAIFFHDAGQEREARESVEAIEKTKPFKDPIVTEIVPASTFIRLRTTIRSTTARTRFGIDSIGTLAAATGGCANFGKRQAEVTDMTKHSMNRLRRRTVLAGLVAAPAAIIWGLAESGRLSPASDQAVSPASGVTKVAIVEFSDLGESKGLVMQDRVAKPDAEWRKMLDAEQYEVTRRKGTEPPFANKYADNHAKGIYRCVCCGNALFSSDTKFDSGTGWPSFYAPIAPQNIRTETDQLLVHDPHRSPMRAMHGASGARLR